MITLVEGQSAGCPEEQSVGCLEEWFVGCLEEQSVGCLEKGSVDCLEGDETDQHQKVDLLHHGNLRTKIVWKGASEWDPQKVKYRPDLTPHRLPQKGRELRHSKDQ